MFSTCFLLNVPVSVSSCHDLPFSRPLRSLEWSDDVGLSVAAQLLLGSTWFVSPVITCYNMLLVGGVEHLDYVPYIGNFIIPTDFHIFQRGWNHQPGYNLVSNVSPTINLPFGDGSYKPFVIYEISGMVHSWVYHIGIEDLRSPGYHRPLTERDASDAPPNRPPINIQP